MVANRYTVAVYTGYYKPILQLILVVAQRFSNTFIPSVPIGPGSKYQKSKIHWSMPYVGECWVKIFPILHSPILRRRGPTVFAKSPTIPEPQISGGKFSHRKFSPMWEICP